MTNSIRPPLAEHVLRRSGRNELLNTSFLSGIAIFIGHISGFVVAKIVAVYVGPAGIALISQFQNFVGIATAVANGGIRQGVTKYVAETRIYPEETACVLSTSVRFTLISSVTIGAVICIFARVLSMRLMQTADYASIFFLFGLTVVLFALNVLIISILNGFSEIGKLVGVKISTSLFGLFVMTTLTFFFGVPGALIAISLSQSVVFFISLIYVLRSDWFRLEYLALGIHWGYAKKLGNYSLMAITSMVVVPLVQIGIRDHIIENLSITEAGYWDSLTRISHAYLAIITTTLSVYYLPKLSSLKEKDLLRKEIWQGYKIILPFLVVLIVSVFTLRSQIISILYSRQFLAIQDLFLPQLLGDFLLIASWLVAYLMLAKAKTKMFISTQLVFSTITYKLSIFLIDRFGLIGVTYAHAVKYLLYLIVVLFLFRDTVFPSWKKSP